MLACHCLLVKLLLTLLPFFVSWKASDLLKSNSYSLVLVLTLHMPFCILFFSNVSQRYLYAF